jgi:hypothetical protein
LSNQNIKIKPSKFKTSPKRFDIKKLTKGDLVIKIFISVGEILLQTHGEVKFENSFSHNLHK